MMKNNMQILLERLDFTEKLKKQLNIQPTKYMDCNGETICYGDILKILSAEKLPKSKYSPKTPFAMIVYKDGEGICFMLAVWMNICQ